MLPVPWASTHPSIRCSELLLSLWWPGRDLYRARFLSCDASYLPSVHSRPCSPVPVRKLHRTTGGKSCRPAEELMEAQSLLAPAQCLDSPFVGKVDAGLQHALLVKMPSSTADVFP